MKTTANVMSGKPRIIWFTQLETPPATYGNVPSSSRPMSALSRAETGVLVGSSLALACRAHAALPGSRPATSSAPPAAAAPRTALSESELKMRRTSL